MCNLRPGHETLAQLYAALGLGMRLMHYVIFAPAFSPLLFVRIVFLTLYSIILVVIIHYQKLGSAP